MTLGTFDYISPEQALEPRDADVRSDIYSLGCTFYHALTGQPPVPEGTAARKLQHHQNEAPIDPRQLNPDIPDEVTAILARMMAKNPKQRYQRPEQVTQHLLQVAQELGMTTEIPDGMVFADVPLPRVPRSRPVLLAVAAVVALILLVVLLGQLPRGSTPPTNGSPIKVEPKINTPTEQNHKGSSVAAGTDQQPVKPSTNGTRPAPYEEDPPTAKGLADYLRKHAGAQELQIILTGDLQLPGDLEVDSPEWSSGLRFKAPKMTIKPKEGLARPPTIWFAQDDRMPQSMLAALTIESDSATLQGLRIVVNPKGFADVKMAGVWLRGGGTHTVRQCKFVLLEGPQAAAVVAENSEGNLTECYFVSARERVLHPELVQGMELIDVGNGGPDAVLVTGGAEITATNCAFAPHINLVHLRGDDTKSARVHLDQCSAFLGDSSAVFHVDNWRAACNLAASHCIFSHLDRITEVGEEDGPKEQPAGSAAVLIRQSGPTFGASGLPGQG